MVEIMRNGPWLRALVTSSVVAGMAIACSAPAEDDSSADHYQEEGLTGSVTDSNGTFQYVDTHDQYGNTGVVDKSKFLYFQKVRGKRAVGLTMDCAWVEPANANEVLDVLAKHHAKITFFISGPFIFKNEKLGLEGGLDPKNFPTIRRMIADGHEFGNHTQTHPHNDQSIDWQRETEELRRGWDALLTQIYAGHPIPPNAKMLDYWRAPYGEYDRRALGLAAEAGFPFHFGWNVDVRDSTGLPDCKVEPTNPKCLSPAKLTDFALAFADKNKWSLDGFVILSHLQNPYHWGAQPEGLERLLSTVEARGQVIARVSEMFVAPR